MLPGAAVSLWRAIETGVALGVAIVVAAGLIGGIKALVTPRRPPG